jgi:CheY-like chemotaxis protein
MGKERILVVDDNPTNSKLARIVLEMADFVVSDVADGEAALLEVDAFGPDLILMDIQLPGMDGLEVTRRIKDRPEHSNIVIVALTAYAMKEDSERVAAAGCDGYISKPIDTRALPEQVREYLKNRSAAGSSSV